MTERTFREPSPNRGPSRSQEDDLPPVPALPKGYMSSMSPPPLPMKSDKRPASVEPPQRIASPLAKPSGGRGVSLDRGPGVMTGRLNRQSGVRSSNAASTDEAMSLGNRNSVNFSRPMSPANSPPSSPVTGRTFNLPSNVHTTMSPSLPQAKLPALETRNIQRSMQETANRPVKKKKKAAAQTFAEGSHLSKGTTGGRPTGTAVNETSRSGPAAPDTVVAETRSSIDSTRSTPKKARKKKAKPASELPSHQPEVSQSKYVSDSDSASETSFSSDRPRTYNTRAAGLLMKQPSIVREDWEGEEKEERSSSFTGSKEKAATNGNTKPTEAVDKTPIQSGNTRPVTETAGRSNSTLQPEEYQPARNAKEASQTLGANVGKTLEAKPSSVTSARATHFSAQPTYDSPGGTRHQPPPRSVSPAKSALKNSPSLRGVSLAELVPNGLSRIGNRAPSEASDTTSVISDEGSRAPARRKKNVRVSFDEDTVMVGRAASPPTTPDSPVLMSPQNKDTRKKTWFGLGREKTEVPSPEADDVMKPRPVLPSFGSVRGRQEMEETAALTNAGKNEQGTSKDHAIGSIVSQNPPRSRDGQSLEASPKQLSNEPLPPEVTTVEGTGYNSDTDESVISDYDHNTQQTKEEVDVPPMADPTTSERTKEGDVISSNPAQSEPVPSIAIQPATPGLEDSLQRESTYWMPGGFPMSTENLNRDYTIESTSDDAGINSTPASVGIAEPETEETSAHSDPNVPTVGEVAHSLRHQIETADNESEGTEESIYSDAEEDFPDVEGDGFLSLDAIVESPAVQPKSDPVPVLPETPSKPKQKSTALETMVREDNDLLKTTDQEGWDKASEHWSRLTQRKEQNEETSPTATSIAPKAASQETVSKPKKKKKTVPKAPADSASSRDPPLPPWPDRQYIEESKRPKSPRATEMKKSMRASPQVLEDAHMRTSMRGNPPLRSALRSSPQRNSVQIQPSPEPRGALQKRNRPMSAVAAVDLGLPSKPTVGQNGLASNRPTPQSLRPLVTPATKKPPQPSSSLARTRSNDSDSSSSFKRMRPKTADNGRYTMKRSMRGSSADERPRSSFSNQPNSMESRSFSPSGAGQRPLKSNGPGMRTSMRGSIDSNASRSSFAFGKSAKPKPKAAKSGSRFSSRFGDSSDEEDGSKGFSSRFDDSSDEDEPTNMAAAFAPVRGIPARVDEGDSTDLEDSSQETVPNAANGKSNRKTNGQTNGKTSSIEPSTQEGKALASGSLRGRANPTDAHVGNGMNSDVQAEKKKKSFFGGFGKKRTGPALPEIRASPQLETPRKADKADKAEQVLGAGSPSATQSPKSPKLQRRNTPKSFPISSPTSDWPLPASPSTATNSRPTTADGAAIRGRPDLGTRRSTVQAVDANGGTLGKGGKKKKFPMLRKALGLHD